jgi:hypothetical protein
MRQALALTLLLLARAAFAADPPRLVVGSDAGLQEVGLDGKVLATLTTTPARYPRYLPGSDRRVIVFLAPRGKGPYAPYAELRRFSLRERREETIAKLPRQELRCSRRFPSDIARSELLIQDENHDFVLSRTAACLHLLDRNSNMASAQVSLRVDLGRGKVARRFIVISQGCRVGGRASADDARPFECGRLAGRHLAGPASAPALRPAGPRYRLERGRLIRVEGKRAVVAARMSAAFVEDPFTETKTLSRQDRYAVVKGASALGDYLHYAVLVLDRETGNLYPVLAGPWPAPITPAKLRGWRPRELHRATRDVVGEEALHPIGAGSAFHVGTTLVVPGSHTVELPGQLAE